MFGSTTLAISTVLATFMGGLGLGSYLAGRYADRIKNPVRAYALAEAGIGLYALLIPVILWAYPALNRWMYRVFGDRWLLLSMVRFVGVGGAAADPDHADGRDAAAAVAPLRDAAVGAAALRACASARSTRSTCSARSRARSSPASCSCRCIGVTWTNVTAASFNLTLAAAIMHRAPPPARRRRGRRAPPRSGWTMAAVEAHLETTALPPPPVIDARSRRAVLAAFAVSGATAMTLAGAVDARAGGAARARRCSRSR